MEIKYSVLHPTIDIINLQTNTTIIVPFSSLTNKYRVFLSDIIIEKELTYEEKDRYWFKPKTFSQDMYETTQLWDTLLILNEYTSVTQFKPDIIKYYDPEEFKDYLNEIMILEHAIE
jgi:hypothetical protein